MKKALGLIETKGLVAAVAAADKALKSAKVILEGKEITEPGYVTIRFTGGLSEIQIAVAAGAEAARDTGELISSIVIADPDSQLSVLLHPVSLPIQSEQKTAEPRISNETETQKIKATLPAPSPSQGEGRGEVKKEKKGKVLDTITRLRMEALGKSRIESSPEILIVKEDNNQDLDELNVHQLRKLARNTPDFPIFGRKISKANRTELLKLFNGIKN